ncbi:MULTISPECIES: hypothetical protein [unclassified Frankia]|uniref:hypothetical protein n=1 Tax=unclassified Frankia TaxID=2632575 RepID=UPI001EF5BD91|nr:MULTISPECIES: hypothetical protein [unclassified Frankia]
MALRISVDLDGLRWADLFRFVDLARNGGIGPEDQVDVITYGSDPLSVSLSARIYPSDSFGPGDQELGNEAAGRSSAPAGTPPVATASPNGSSFGYDVTPGERGAAANGAHYPAFEAPGERPGPSTPSLPSFGGYDGQGDRGGPPAASGTHYPAFDGQGGDRIGPGGAGGQFAGFEPVFDRQGGVKEPGAGGQGQVESPYIEEFARLQEGLMRQARRPEEVRPERG